MAATEVLEVDLERQVATNAEREQERCGSRQASMMEDVPRGLIEKVREAAASEGERAISMQSKNDSNCPHCGSPCTSELCASDQAAAAAIMAPIFPDVPYEKEVVELCCKFSFRRWVLGAITFCVLLASTSMFIALDRSINNIRNSAIEHCGNAMKQQNVTVDQLVDKNVTATSFRATLRFMSWMVEEIIDVPTVRAVSVILGSMRSARHFDASWDGRVPIHRDRIAHRAWVELTRQWDLQDSSPSVENPRSQGASAMMKAADSLTVRFISGEVAGGEVRRPEFSCPGAGKAACGTCLGWCSKLTFSVLDAAGSINGSTRLTHWDVKSGEWDHQTMASQEAYTPLATPSLDVHIARRSMAEALPGGAAAVPAVPLWSEVYFSWRTPTMSFSTPIAFCGDYSCLEGAIAAEVALQRISVDCVTAWTNLSRLLASSAYDFPIGSTNSSLFVVHVTGASNQNTGQLIGTSDAYPITDHVQAEHASQEVVRATALALLNKFGAWSSSKLVDTEQLFTFNRQSALRGQFSGCTGLDLRRHDCLQTGTLSVKLDDQTSWLLVATLPAGAFSSKAVSAAQDTKQKVEDLSKESHSYVNAARMTGVGIIFFIAAISISLGFLLGCAVSEPLQSLGDRMRRMKELDWGTKLCDLRSGQRPTYIQDITELQEAFCSLVRGIEAFTRFVPGTVVTRVIRGERGGSLHVDRRDVTVMFASIGNFGKLSNQLTEEELVLVIGFYHTVMTRIVEHFQGAVCEILDDGLLVYWNTPDSVEHHAMKACEAAFAQQRAMEWLNSELADRGLPALTAHIGIHSGNVLSGNIGTDRKMKFGCMGDSVNLASRLNGCCKYYQVGTICSGATHDKLPRNVRILFRELDLVRVNGRRESTRIFEIIGPQQPQPEPQTSATDTVNSSTPATKPSGKVNKAFSRSPAAALGPTSAAFFHVPDLRTTPRRSQIGRLDWRCRSPSVASRFSNQSPMADHPGERFSGPFCLPKTVSLPPASSSRDDGVSGEGGSASLSEETSQQQQPDERTLSGRVLKVQVPLVLAHIVPRRPSLVPGDLTPAPTPIGPTSADRETLGHRADAVSAASSKTDHVTPLNCHSCVTDEQRARARRYEEALHQYQQAHFISAWQTACELDRDYPGDVPTQKLLKLLNLQVAEDGKEIVLSEDQKRAWTGETRMDCK